jgi:hypothetical protein
VTHSGNTTMKSLTLRSPLTNTSVPYIEKLTAILTRHAQVHVYCEGETSLALLDLFLNAQVRLLLRLDGEAERAQVKYIQKFEDKSRSTRDDSLSPTNLYPITSHDFYCQFGAKLRRLIFLRLSSTHLKPGLNCHSMLSSHCNGP